MSQEPNGHNDPAPDIDMHTATPAVLPQPSEFDTLLAELNRDGDQPEKWRALVDLAEKSGQTEQIKQAYESLLARYPNTALAQIAYIGHFLNNPSTFQQAEALFTRFVKSSPSVELFRFYLTYIRRIHADPSKKDTNKREIIRKAYEFALNPPHGIGQDKDSGDIWLDYIQFLTETEASTTWDQQQNMDALRKVYHRAVQIPLDNVGRLWQDLEAFEMKLSRITAKKFMGDLSPAHTQARAVYRQLEKHIKDLYPSTEAAHNEIFLPSPPIFSPDDRQLVNKWKAYLKWEESNPLMLDDKDRPLLILRIANVYRKAVIRMRYFSEIWFMSYVWNKSIGRNDEAMAILKAGREANPLSNLLTYAYIEALEIDKKYDEVKTVLDGFIDALKPELERLEERALARAAEKLKEDDPMDSSQETELTSNPSSTAHQRKDPEEQELEERKKEYGVVYIMYMRFIRRTEGVIGSRGIFKKARGDKFVGWNVYEAAAMLEFHCGEDKSVPTKIFVAANKKFDTDPDFVCRYLSYLLSIGDEQNARTVFQVSTSKIPPDQARPIWERWARYEYQYGDLEASLKLEKRIAEVYPNESSMKRFAQRYIWSNTDTIASRDLGVSAVRKQPTLSSPNNSGFNQPARTDMSFSSSGNILNNVGGMKRPASPQDHSANRGQRQDKRQRATSPTRDKEREHGPGSRVPRRHSPDRTRGRDQSRRGDDRVPKDEPPAVILPSVLLWFHGQLPPASAFDGPVFRTDDLMNLLRTAVIPASTSQTGRRSPPSVAGQGPPRASSSGRPPPDYSPYTGPNSAQSRPRRY